MDSMKNEKLNLSISLIADELKEIKLLKQRAHNVI